MKLAISVPVGHWHDFLPSALESLAVQQGDVAVALLDASGDPRVRNLADQYAGLLSYRRHGPDAGQSDAILEGWANVDGDWLGWLNADDLLMPDAVSRVRAALADAPGLDAIYGHSTILNDRGDMTGYHFNVEPPSDRLLQAGIISQPSCFFSRAAYDAAGGLDRTLHYVMDWDLWIRMYKSGAAFGFVDQPLSMVLWGAGTKTASLNRRRREELRMLIARHAPADLQRATFRDFAIHALIDRIWPKALRQRIIRKLRGIGPSVGGIRADGALAGEPELVLAHYDATPKPALLLEFDRAPDALQVMAGADIAACHIEGRLARISFVRPIPAGERLVLQLQHESRGEFYFRRASWLEKA